MAAVHGHHSPNWRHSLLWCRYGSHERLAICLPHPSAPASSPLLLAHLLQLYLVIRLTNLFSEYAALIYLRHSDPDRSRPWKIPGGLVGVYALVLPSVAVAGLALYTADREVLITGGAATGAIVIVGVCYGLYRRYCMKPASTTVN